MQFRRTTDAAEVRRMIAGCDLIYHAATDDFAPPAGEFSPNMNPGIWYVVAEDALGVVCMFTLIPRSEVCWDIHLTRAFGGRVVKALGALVAWLRAVSGCKRLLASIPETNRAAVRMARRLRWDEIGRNRRSFMKGGRLVDQVLFSQEV